MKEVKKVGAEYTLIEALAECFSFNPRKKKLQEIVFKITDPDSSEYVMFGKNWSKNEGKWVYFTKDTYGPALVSEDRHFVSNLFSFTFAHNFMTYAAQQGRYVVEKYADTTLDKE